MANYITNVQLKDFVVANEADVDTTYDTLVTAVSRLFDRECEVVDDFFSGTGIPTIKVFKGNDTRYLRVPPMSGLVVLEVDGTDIYDVNPATATYQLEAGYIIFDTVVSRTSVFSITAVWGFAVIPADIQTACLEQAALMLRRKDLSFAEMSGVPATAVAAELAPTFAEAARKYREIYSPNLFVS